MFGWGEKDNTTKTERDNAKKNAEKQIREQNGTDTDDSTGDGQPPRHASKSRWW